MLSYCLKCRKNIESKNPRFVRAINSRMMLSSNCADCGNKKSKFIKEQKGKLSVIGKIPLLGK